MLQLLHARDVPAMLMLMPVNEATYAAIPTVVRESLLNYLADVQRRFPWLVVADEDLPHWPPQYFGDGAMHLGPEGTSVVAAILNRCIGEDAPRRGTDCRLSMSPR